MTDDDLRAIGICPEFIDVFLAVENIVCKRTGVDLPRDKVRLVTRRMVRFFDGA